MAKNVVLRGEALWWTKAKQMLENEELRREVDMFALLIPRGAGMTRSEAMMRDGAISEARVYLVGVRAGDLRPLTLEARDLQ